MAENHILHLPVGFRFKPTDEEIISSFLKPKIQSLPLPHPIPVADVNKTDPWDLPGDLEEERFFFSTMQMKYSTSTRCDRSTPSGYWKATNTNKKVFDSENNQIGTKRTLVFYLNNRPKPIKTNWIVHEYKTTNPIHGVPNWSVCRLFQKASARNDVAEQEEMVPVQNTGLGSNGPRSFDLNLEAVGSSSCGSCEDEDVSI